MRKLIIVLLFIISSESYGQIAAKVIQFRPSGDFGALMKRTFTGEIMYMTQFDPYLRVRAGLGFVPLQTRVDTLKYVTVRDGNYLIPSYITYRKYNMFVGFFGLDVSVLDNEHFNPYLGFDILAGTVVVDYDKRIPTLLEESAAVSYMLVGFRPRIGFEYTFYEHYGIFLEVSRGMYLITEQGLYANNDIGLGFHYTFNP
jgi:hypothetical protein